MRLAIDLGGTNIRIAQVNNGLCVKKTSIVCPAQEEAAEILNQLFHIIGSMMNGDVTGIGVGVPSIVDARSGTVYNVANIPSWKEIGLKDILEKGFGVPVSINNDSNCFALGESIYGAGQPYANMVGVTIGTGIGAGVIINHKLYGGAYLGAGEIGSLPYLDSDFEHYCSSFYFKKYNTTGEIAAHEARQGNMVSLTLWNEFGGHLGQLIKAILFTYAPQAIVLGGGIVSAFPLFKESMERAMCDFPYQLMVKDLKVIPSALDDAALLGASALMDE